ALAQKPVAQVELAGASAIFADDSVILVNAKDATSVTLYYSESGELAFDSASKKVTGATKQITSSKAASTYNADKQAQTAIAMTFDATSGAWVAANTALKHGDFYRYEVTVYHPATDKVETYQVTDPYSLSLSMNSEYSQVVDLANAELKPSGWD
ncbi:hypothetical protein JS84_24950, partial [Vibrio vulnificus]